MRNRTPSLSIDPVERHFVDLLKRLSAEAKMEVMCDLVAHCEIEERARVECRRLIARAGAAHATR